MYSTRGRVKQTPRMSTGGRAPRKQLARKAHNVRGIGVMYQTSVSVDQKGIGTPKAKLSSVPKSAVAALEDCSNDSDDDDDDSKELHDNLASELEKAKKTIDLMKLKLNELQDIPKCTICHHHPAFFIGMCGHRICCSECHSNSSCRHYIYKLSNCPLCRKWIGLDSGEMLYQLKH